MHLPLSVLICLSAVQLCMGDEPVEEVITTRHVAPLGGWTDRDPDSPEVKDAAQHALNMFNLGSKKKRMFTLVSINTAQSQVTHMINYKINAILSKTKCLKSENHELNSCPLAKKRLTCHFNVAFNPLKKKHELSMQKCKKIEKSAE